MTNASPLLTVADVARLFLVNPQTVRRWRIAGRLRGIKVGKAIRFAARDVDALLERVSDAGAPDRESRG